jgi:accessory gene regulator B
MLTIAKKTSKSLCNQLNIIGEKAEVIEYGMIAMVQLIVFTSIIVIVGLFTKTVCEALTICATTSILRKSSGGVHVRSINSCTIIGVCFCLLASVWIRYILIDVITFSGIILLTGMVLVMAYGIIYLKAPMDTPNKPINTTKKRKRLRKSCYRIISIYGVIMIGLIVGVKMTGFDYTYGLCIIFGLMWQVMSLTKFGSCFIGFLDNKIWRVWKIFRKTTSSGTN